MSQKEGHHKSPALLKINTDMNILIINLYIVSHILYGRNLYEFILWGLCVCLKETGGSQYPHHLVEYIAIVQPASVQIQKCGSWEGIWSCIRQPRISQRWPIGYGLGLRRPAKGVWHDQLENSSLSYCRYAGNVLLEENFFPTVW